MTVMHVNPPELPQHPAFSHAVVVREPRATIYVGGQNATDGDGKVVGDDLATQTTRALENLEAVLVAADASFHDVVHWTVAVVDDQPLAEGLQAFADKWGKDAEPPAVSVHVVAGLANPEFLVEIDAVAAV